ncbi:MAG TPA: SLC13 family permease [Dermatophilaceae bacterium]|nr:SLC13 family permease [Dermatophilaceae bacterium]
MRAGVAPNIIVASRSGLSFNDFAANLGPIVVILLVVFIGLCRIMFRSAFTYDEQRAAAVMELDETEMIRDRGLLVRSGIILGAVVVGFTVSLLIGELAFGPGSDRDNHVKVTVLAVLAGSITAAALAGILLRARSNLYQRLFAEEAADPDHDGTPNAYQSDQ